MGYELDVWRRRAVLEASVAMTVADAEDRGDELGAAAAGLADAAAALAAAITAIPTDRMAVPAHVAIALNRWVVC